MNTFKITLDTYISLRYYSSHLEFTVIYGRLTFTTAKHLIYIYYPYKFTLDKCTNLKLMENIPN